MSVPKPMSLRMLLNGLKKTLIWNESSIKAETLFTYLEELLVQMDGWIV